MEKLFVVLFVSKYGDNTPEIVYGISRVVDAIRGYILDLDLEEAEIDRLRDEVSEEEILYRIQTDIEHCYFKEFHIDVSDSVKVSEATEDSMKEIKLYFSEYGLKNS